MLLLQLITIKFKGVITFKTLDNKNVNLNFYKIMLKILFTFFKNKCFKF